MTRGWEIVLDLCRQGRDAIRAGNLPVGSARLDAAEKQIRFAGIYAEHPSYAQTIGHLAGMARDKLAADAAPRHATAAEETQVSDEAMLDSAMAAMRAAVGGGFGNAGVTPDDLVDFLNNIAGKTKR